MVEKFPQEITIHNADLGRQFIDQLNARLVDALRTGVDPNLTALANMLTSERLEDSIVRLLPASSVRPTKEFWSEVLAIVVWIMRNGTIKIIVRTPRQRSGPARLVDKLSKNLRVARNTLRQIQNDHYLRIMLPARFAAAVHKARIDEAEDQLVKDGDPSTAVQNSQNNRQEISEISTTLDHWIAALANEANHLKVELAAAKKLGTPPQAGRPKDQWSRGGIMLLAHCWRYYFGLDLEADHFLRETERFREFVNFILSKMGFPHVEGSSFDRQIDDVLRGNYSLPINEMA